MEKLKKIIYTDIFMNKENDQLEEDIRKEVDRDFFLDTIDEDLVESDEEIDILEESESKESKCETKEEESEEELNELNEIKDAMWSMTDNVVFLFY